MKVSTLLTVTLLAIVSFQANANDYQVFKTALHNFTYVADIDNELKIYTHIDRAFSGDCDDLAINLKNRMGGDIYFIRLDTGEAHAALVKNGKVYDQRGISWVENYKGKLIYKMSLKSFSSVEYINN